ncbi:MAG: GIY-YIG nuclease family protein [Candidatus Omnitrophica bacterium]|nr:GIY-YIG nuclease family protein [Candidatus Omnitrophota bacterium]
MYYVYAIVNKDNRIYVGITKDLIFRVKEHNRKKTKSTKGYAPWDLFYKEKLPDRVSARQREKQLKSGCGKEYLKEVLKTRACSSVG